MSQRVGRTVTNKPFATGALAPGADSARPLSRPLVLRTPTPVPPVLSHPDVELESHDSSAEDASSGEKCFGD